MSASARFELIPIVSTAIFVQAGEATADALVRLAHLTPFSTKLEGPAVTDVTGMLLLLNFAVVVWFAYRTLKESVAGGEPVTLNAKLVGLSTAFLTSADLVAYGVKSGHPDRTIYALLVLLFVFVVPFFLIRRRPASDAAPAEGALGRHALGAMALVVNAVLPAVAGIVVASLYEVVLNDGIGPFPSFVISVLHQSARTEYWGVSPGVVGIAWVPLVLCTYRWTDQSEPSIALGLDWKGVMGLALFSACVLVLMAIVLIDNGTLLLGPPPAGVTWVTLIAAKIIFALVIASSFTGAFLLTQTIDERAWRPAAKLAATLLGFAVAGAVVGASLMAIRLRIAHASPHSLALVLLHASGFVVAYAAGRVTLRILSREFANLSLKASTPA